MAVPHSITPWDTRTESGTHYSVSQHHTMRHGDRERYTLQRLTASHHGTRGQREVHITVSHSTTPWNIRTEKGTHCSISPHHTKRHGDRERYTLQCLTTPHHETRGEREVHMTVSHSTPSYELTTKRGTYDCLTAPHCTTGGKTKIHNNSLTQQGQARTRDRCLHVFDAVLFVPASTLKIYFQKFRTPMCRFTYDAWFSCRKFLTLRHLGLLNPHTAFLPLLAFECEQNMEITQSKYQSHSLLSCTGRLIVYNLELRSFVHRCVNVHAPYVSVRYK